MRIGHRAVTSPVFELVKTVELDIQMVENDAWAMRIEFFRDTGQPNRYRYCVLESARDRPRVIGPSRRRAPKRR